MQTAVALVTGTSLALRWIKGDVSPRYGILSAVKSEEKKFIPHAVNEAFKNGDKILGTTYKSKRNYSAHFVYET